MDELAFEGHGGKLYGRRWDHADPRYVALLCHGYGEHIGRYEHVADRLLKDGATVYGIDHVGHGRSEGERALVDDFDAVVRDFHLLRERAVADHPGVPVVLIGHSMGGLIAARYAQEHGDKLACVVLSGPVLGQFSVPAAILEMPQIPDAPIDPAVLSRDLEIGAAYAADDLVWHGPFKRQTLEAFVAAEAQLNDSRRLPVPSAWLHGTGDQLVPYDEARTGWVLIRPDERIEVAYDDARHEIFNETNKEDVLDDVVSFVHSHL